MSVVFEEDFDDLASGVVVNAGRLDIAFRDSAKVFNDSASATTICPIPTGIQDGDLMLAMLVSSDTVAGASITSAPTGWTVERAHTSFGTASSAIYRRVKQSGDTAASWTLSAARDVQVVILAYSGVDTSTPIDVSAYATRSGAATTTVAPAVTTTGPDRMIVRLFGEKSSTTTSITAPAGTTQRSVSLGSGASSTSSLGVDVEQEATGTTGTATATYNVSSSNGFAATIALKPASATANTAWVSQRGTGALPVTTNMTAITGDIACQFECSTATNGRYMLDNLSAEHDQYWYRFYIYPLSAPTANDVIFGYEQDDVAKASIRVNTDLTLTLRHGTTAIATTTSALISNKWNRIEFNVNSVANTSRLELYAWPNQNDVQPTQFIERTDYTESGTLEEVITGFSGTATWSYLIDAIVGDNFYRPGPVPAEETPPPIVQAPLPPVWNMIAGPATGGYETAIVRPQQREFTYRLNQPTVVRFSVDGRSLDATELDELSTDVHGIRDGQIMFRNRVGAGEDNFNESTHVVEFSCVDYMGMLSRRTIQSGDTTTFTSTDQGDIAWTLINNTQSNTAGALGIVRRLPGTTGQTFTVTYEVGTKIFDEIRNLSEQVNGFDWEIVPTSATALQFNIYAPSRGSDKGVVLEYGGAVASGKRLVDPTEFANAGRFTGGLDTLTPVDYFASGSPPEGLWDITEGYPEVIDQDILNARAAWRIAQLNVLVPTYSLALKDGFWLGPSHIWLGDTVRIIIKSGRLNVDTETRVQEIRINIDDEGNEHVELTTGPFAYNMYESIRKLLSRVNKLEFR